jgi:hypothetical protein
MLLCGLTFCNLAAAVELGRLFFTPQERTQLSDEYNKRDRGNGIGNMGEVAVNGIVQKHGGTRTVWINGQAQAASKEERDPTSAQVTLPGQSHPIKIKVGERSNLSAGNNKP